MRLADLGFKAFAEALPDRVPACSKSVVCNMGCGGVDPRTGDFYTFMETLAGGYGGRQGMDGLDAVQAHIQNTENSAIEETENNYPIRIVRYELVEDSDGAGKYRGGLGLRRDWQFPGHEASFTVFSGHRKKGPWGLFGGGSGRPSTYTHNPDGEAVELPSKITLSLGTDDIISYRTPGGGGYGDALERDPEAVLADVVDGKVSLARARDVYGVVIDESSRLIDMTATENRRTEIRVSRPDSR
jgi:N-methylhydantoinase B